MLAVYYGDMGAGLSEHIVRFRHVSSLHDGEAALKAVNFDLVIVDIQIQGYTVRYSYESTPAFLSKGRQKFLGKVRHLKVA